MRVLVQRGSIAEGLVARLLPETHAEIVVVFDRLELERQLRDDDIVIASVSDLPFLASRSRPVVFFGELRVAACATYGDKFLELRRSELAVLYELARAQGAYLTRADLHARCGASKGTKARSVDVTVHRLRRRIEAATPLRVPFDRPFGYRLAVPEPPRKRILVVEDEKLMRRAYARLFTQIGVEVDFAEDVAMGKAMAQTRYAAYIIDLLLPGGSGADVIPIIQRHSPLASIMIVTARTDTAAIQLSGRYGVGYMEKPARTLDLQRFVQRALTTQ